LLKGYLTGFFYLASWGPIYAVLHMFITQYSAAQLSALAPNGMTMATMAGIDSVNQNMETLAGYLLMFVPVMAAGMAKAPCRSPRTPPPCWHPRCTRPRPPRSSGPPATMPMATASSRT
jgi:hypothetical protein